jgi:hypothetical protein
MESIKTKEWIFVPFPSTQEQFDNFRSLGKIQWLDGNDMYRFLGEDKWNESIEQYVYVDFLTIYFVENGDYVYFMPLADTDVKNFFCEFLNKGALI